MGNIFTKRYEQDENSWECVKAITKALRKEFKGIQANSYGFCCNSDYDAFHEYINGDDYMCAKIFKGGLNNCYHDGRFEIGDEVYWMWNTTEFDIRDILLTMGRVAADFGGKIEFEKDENGAVDRMKCISLSFNYEQ